MPAAFPEVEITEIEKLDADRIDGVENPANGIPILLMKAIEPTEDAPSEPEATPGAEVPGLTPEERAEVIEVVKAVTASGAINEKPDIADAERILVLLAKLIQSEAAEMAAGEFGETCDIGLLLEASHCMKLFRDGEQASADAAKSVETDSPETSAADEPQEGKLSELVASAVTKAMEVHEAANQELRTELAALKATAIPTAVAITAPASVRNQRLRDENLAKAKYYRGLAANVQERELASYYKTQAAAAEQAAGVSA